MSAQMNPRAPGTPLLRTESLVKRFGGLLVTDTVSIEVNPGELHAIIGPNGAGKTTLINQLSGELRADSGQVIFAGQNVTDLNIDQRARRGYEDPPSALFRYNGREAIGLQIGMRDGGNILEFGDRCKSVMAAEAAIYGWFAGSGWN